jgi:hypothetical protein
MLRMCKEPAQSPLAGIHSESDEDSISRHCSFLSSDCFLETWLPRASIMAQNAALASNLQEKDWRSGLKIPERDQRVQTAVRSLRRTARGQLQSKHS